MAYMNLEELSRACRVNKDWFSAMQSMKPLEATMSSKMFCAWSDEYERIKSRLISRHVSEIACNDLINERAWIHHFPRLRVFKTTLGISRMECDYTTHPFLKKLVFTGGPSMHACVSTFRSFPQLTSLTVALSIDLVDAVTMNLCQHLQVLQLHHVNGRGDHFILEEFGNMFSHLPCLESLRMADVNGLYVLTAALVYLPNPCLLKRLHVLTTSSKTIVNASNDKAAHAVKTLKGLQELILPSQGFHIPTVDLFHLPSIDLPLLTSLDIVSVNEGFMVPVVYSYHTDEECLADHVQPPCKVGEFALTISSSNLYRWEGQRFQFIAHMNSL